jgi:hypothetical protein
MDMSHWGDTPISDIVSMHSNILRRVTVPENKQNDHFTDWLHSNIALPIGVQVCSEPSTRVFFVNCTAFDRCTPSRKLKAAARLKVTHIVDRNRVGVIDHQKDEKHSDPLLASHQQMLRQEVGAKLGIDLDKFARDNQKSVGSDPLLGLHPLAASDAIVWDSMNGMKSSGGSSSGSGTVNFQRDPFLNNGADPSQASAFLHSDEFANANSGTSVLASQCRTRVDFVPVHCGDTVSITLDPEDACLARNFDSEHEFLTQHTFKEDEFDGKIDGSMRIFGEQDFVGQTRFKATAVRGTDVELQVLAMDECGNVGRGSDDPARDCETFVAGKCCPPVTNALSQFAINQVLDQAAGPHGMITPTMQLSDIQLDPKLGKLGNHLQLP